MWQAFKTIFLNNMVLKKFSCFVDDTRLIVYRDTLYKIKVYFKDKGTQHGRNSSNTVHSEIEEVIAAVIYMIQNDEALVKIQTEHFMVLPSQYFWKTGEKLKFQQNGKDLNLHSNVINLTFVAQTQSHSEARSAAITSRETQEESVKSYQHQEKDLRNKTTAAPMIDTSSVRKHTSQDKSSYKNAARPIQLSPKQIVTRRSPRRKQQPSSIITPSPNGEKDPTSRSRKRTESELQQATMPGHQEQFRLQSEAGQLSTNVQDSRFHYSLRTGTRLSAQSPPKIVRALSSHADHSPRKSLMQHANNTATDSSVGNVNNTDRNTNNNNAFTNRDTSAHKNEERSDVKKDTHVGLKVTHGSRNHQRQIGTSQTSAEQSVAQNESGGGIRRNSTRIAAITRAKIRKQKQSYQPVNIRTSRHHFELRQTIRRNTVIEERRLRHFLDDQPREDSHTVQTFEQKDRHVIERGNAQEELKLQSLANHSTINCRKESDRNAHKRNRGLVDVFAESLVAPIKRALLGLAKTILQGIVRGSCRRGRWRKRWENNIQEWTGLNMAESQTTAKYRDSGGVVASLSMVPEHHQQMSKDRQR